MNAGCEPKPREILPDPFAAGWIRIQREQVDIGKLKNVAGLSTRRGTCIEHPLAVSQVKIFGGALGTGILDRYIAGGESGQALDAHRGLKEQCRCSCATRPHPLFLEAREVLFGIGAATVHPQAHGRMRIPGREHRGPIVRIGTTHRLDPPIRMAFSGNRIVRNL